jgi:glutathione synthase/RimK-type ligase-like ATP-grasp enzyme
MIRCTNKVYLHEVMTKAGVPTPKTLLLSAGDDLARAADELGFPVVLKAPDSSFSRGVHKAETLEALQTLAKRLFKDTDMLLAQEFMPTTFDWRVGVLDGRPIFASRYKMARGHWQIVRHRPDGRVTEGGSQAVAVEDAPAAVVEAAVKAAGLIGDGLYGVDIKEIDGGVAVIEINDNPDIHHGWEDEIAKDAVWRALVTWFVTRLEA